MTGANEIRWISAARCHVGLVREINEDAFLDRPERSLWAVADGMGGHEAGDLASAMVVSALDGIGPQPGLPELVAAARDRLKDVNRRLRGEALLRDVNIIGSTVVVLIARARSCSYLWAGDSRLYLLRHGRLTLLTHDHSQAEEFRWRDHSQDEEAAQPGHNLITRAVGGLDMLELDEGTVTVGDGDIFLLCSDGLTNQVSEQDIANVLLRSDCSTAADMLIAAALKSGGRDNITAVVVRAEDPDNSDMTVLNPGL
ncbi:MAG TPA: protein phosphatase 2C domain-containing protein [Aromatoleum sp.]|uniref:PP2C family protein-serine/threonine phosphatase n=1 Tax=Aromatoleum sp. TaxID=2307007 RepID=UPI002B47EF17|nr:protein phosphatase 2C domain-containing protein [Aromatoleum sp.]HJV28641.1 protein phosphatase 2C domain-containing protein [Aromatoleum sp.]